MATVPITFEHLSSFLSEVKKAISIGTSEIQTSVSSVHAKLDSQVATIHAKLDAVNTSINTSLPAGVGNSTALAGIEGKVDDVIVKVLTFADKVSAGATAGATAVASDVANLALTSTPPTVPPTPVANINAQGVQTTGLPQIPGSLNVSGSEDPRVGPLIITVQTLQAQVNALQSQLNDLLSLKTQVEGVVKAQTDEQPTKDLNEERLKAVEILAQRVPGIQQTMVQHANKLTTVTMHQAGLQNNLQNLFTSITPLNSEANTVESSPQSSPPPVDIPTSPSTTSGQNLSITLTPIIPASAQILSPPTSPGPAQIISPP